MPEFFPHEAKYAFLVSSQSVPCFVCGDTAGKCHVGDTWADCRHKASAESMGGMGWRHRLNGKATSGAAKKAKAPVVQIHDDDGIDPTTDAIRARLWEIQNSDLDSTGKYRQMSNEVVEWLLSRGRLYFHAERRDFASIMFFDATRCLLLGVQSDAFIAWLADCLAMNRQERSFAFILSAIETAGLGEQSEGILPSAFWARRDNSIYLSNGPGRVVKISPLNVSLEHNGVDGVLFPYGQTLAPWTFSSSSIDPFAACSLFSGMSCTANHGPLLFYLWALSLPTDQRTKPPLVASGTVGSGKTRLVRGLFDLFGIPPKIGAVLKNGEADFWTALDGGGVVCFDNADTRTDWLPDALAAAATAGQQVKRKLYSDSDQVTLRANAWVTITTANPTFASDAGLADRLLVVRLNRRSGATAETTLTDEILKARDSGLSWICKTLAVALADTAPVPTGLNSRHPDFAEFAVRIGRAMGRGEEAIAALRAAESDKSLFNLENDTVGAALLELLSSGAFHGTASELLDKIKAIDPGLDGKLSVKGLGKRLSKLWPHLQSAFRAESYKDRNHFTMYQFGEFAEFAEFQTPISEKSPCEEKNSGFIENGTSNSANSADEDFESELVEQESFPW